MNNAQLQIHNTPDNKVHSIPNVNNETPITRLKVPPVKNTEFPEPPSPTPSRSDSVEKSFLCAKQPTELVFPQTDTIDDQSKTHPKEFSIKHREDLSGGTPWLPEDHCVPSPLKTIVLSAGQRTSLDNANIPGTRACSWEVETHRRRVNRYADLEEEPAKPSHKKSCKFVSEHSNRLTKNNWSLHGDQVSPDVDSIKDLRQHFEAAKTHSSPSAKAGLPTSGANCVTKSPAKVSAEGLEYHSPPKRNLAPPAKAPPSLYKLSEPFLKSVISNGSEDKASKVPVGLGEHETMLLDEIEIGMY